jgi:hypothetical protein
LSRKIQELQSKTSKVNALFGTLGRSLVGKEPTTKLFTQQRNLQTNSSTTESKRLGYLLVISKRNYHGA